MKTAMQELIHNLKLNGYDVSNFPIITNALLKEKEQLLFVMQQTAMYVSAASLDKDIGKLTFDDLYNHIFNQKINYE